MSSKARLPFIAPALTFAVLAAAASLPATTCPITNPCGAPPTALPVGGPMVSLDVGAGECYVITGADAPPSAPLVYQHVNVHDGGKIFFVEGTSQQKAIDLRISSMLVEEGGLVQAGSEKCPFGSQGGTLAIGLWGAAQDFGVATTAGATCKTHGGQCYDSNLTSTGTCCQGGSPEDPCTMACDKDQASGAGRAVLNSFFEGYKPLNYDGIDGDMTTGQNFFGFKVIGVSYGGQLKLYGKKGATYGPAPSSPPTCELPSDYFSADAWAQMSATSWVRLRQDATPQSTTLALDRVVDWSAGDRLVLATSDWYPSHSEVVEVAGVAACSNCADSCPAGDGQCTDVTLTAAPAFEHRGTLAEVPANLSNANHGNPNDTIDTRAAVGLLSRDITLYSLGDTAQDAFPAPKECRLQDQFASGTYDPATDPTKPECFFGGHVLVRQGFGAFEVQGVELRQLGQGGRMGHYPVHFHLAKDSSYAGAYLRDSSIWDSNTRFAVLHGTQGVELSRNVGYLSLGHGFYLEDGSEIDNALCHNLGVSARGSLAEYFASRGDDGDCDPSTSGPGSADCRFVPPIVDGAFTPNSLVDKFQQPPSTIAGTTKTEGSDTLFPVTFWSMNAYNEFVGNKAVGVHGYGSCYWLLGSGVSGASKFLTWAARWEVILPPAPNPMAAPTLLQTAGSGTEADYANFNLAGRQQSPAKSFRGNACSTAPYALQSTLEIPPTDDAGSGFTPVVNPYTRGVPEGQEGSMDGFYHRPRAAGNFLPRRYPGLSGGSPEVANCSQGLPAGSSDPFAVNETYCVATVIDHFTAAHNWSEVNFGSIWLRPEFFLFSNGKVSDQLYGGLGFVSGGAWSQVPPGYFTLTQDGLFAGTTDESSSDAGPRGHEYLLTDPHCGNGTQCCATGQCVLPSEGIGLFTGGFNPKRLITIYDGPFYGDGNVFWDTESFACTPEKNHVNSCRLYLSTFQPGCLTGSCPTPYPYSQGAPDEMVVSNAAIGWKQTNGFYYPPVFGFRNTAFDLSTGSPLSKRHVVIDQYQPYLRNFAANPVLPAAQEWNPLGEEFPNSITPIDFSTIINDFDGTFNGLVVEDAQGQPLSTHTAAVSENRFFDAPAQTFDDTPGAPVNAGQECESFGSRTSAYEFVTTVVGKAEQSGQEWFVDSRSWQDPAPGTHTDRSFPAVAIYRQLLMPGEQGTCSANDGNICDGTAWACDRGTFMTGAQAGQAPYLTMDRGVYYIDTSGSTFQSSTPPCVKAPTAFEGDPPIEIELFYLPEFVPDNHYAVWQLFAKPETKVSYQLYVGESFDPATDLEWVRVDPHVFSTAGIGGGNDLAIQPAQGGDYGDFRFDACTGVLEISLDNSRVAADCEITQRDEATRCVPRDLCQFELEDAMNPDSGRCVTSLPASDPLHGQADAACRSWVTATAGTTEASDAQLGDLSLADCPAGGCIGFVFTLPSDFMPASYAEKGLDYAGCFGAPSQGTTWQTPLVALTGTGITNSCAVPAFPGLCTDEPAHVCGAGCCTGGGGLFADDFESSDISAWDESAP